MHIYQKELSWFFQKKIIINQLNNLIKYENVNKNNNNSFIGDKAYNSNNIKSKLKELNLGYLITPINKRNTKNINILKMYKDTYIINIKNYWKKDII
jgi:hypothetical protein